MGMPNVQLTPQLQTIPRQGPMQFAKSRCEIVEAKERENFFLSIWQDLREQLIARVTIDKGEWKELRSTRVFLL